MLCTLQEEPVLSFSMYICTKLIEGLVKMRKLQQKTISLIVCIQPLVPSNNKGFDFSLKFFSREAICFIKKKKGPLKCIFLNQRHRIQQKIILYYMNSLLYVTTNLVSNPISDKWNKKKKKLQAIKCLNLIDHPLTQRE